MPFEILYSDQPVFHCVHTHVHYELLYVQEGAVVVVINGKEHRVQAGSLVFLNQFEAHATRMISDVYKRYYLLLPITQLGAFRNDVRLLSVFRFHGEHFPYVLNAGADKARFDTYFALLMDVKERGGAYMDEKIEALMTLILADALTLRPDMFSFAKDVSFLPMRDILDEMDRCFADKFSLSELAAKFHVSAGCLSAHFRRCVGMSPMQYITKSRLTLARAMLINTEKTMLEISLECGYGDVSNFVRRFRQQFQVTPLRFRHLHEKVTQHTEKMR